jgi:hypothetical protein
MYPKKSDICDGNPHSDETYQRFKTVIASAAKQSMAQQRVDCFVASLLAMTAEYL